MHHHLETEDSSVTYRETYVYAANSYNFVKIVQISS
jgi:hypothetical protein